MLLFFTFLSFCAAPTDSVISATNALKAIIQSDPGEPKFWVIRYLWDFLKDIGMTDRMADMLTFGAACLILIGLIWIVDKVVVRISLHYIKKAAAKSVSEIDDIFVNRKFFHRLFQLLPLFVILQTTGKIFQGFSPGMISFVDVITEAAIIIVVMMIIFSLLDSWNDMYDRKVYEHRKSIKGYIQVAKIIISIIGGILAISVIFHKNPSTLFVGLGTAAALLSLVFKDTILGFVASIQLSAQDMVRIGDWISMPSKNADGTVIEINVNSVKVQNWDNTVTMIPIYSMVSESFTNWQSMEQSQGRRFVRYFYFDISSVKFADQNFLAKLAASKEISKQYDQISMPAERSSPGEILTNLALMRANIELFLRRNPDINDELTLFVRYKQDITDKGIGLEIYAFSYGKTAVESEAVQRSLVEFVIASAPLFDIRLFQSPSGMDFRRVISGQEPVE